MPKSYYQLLEKNPRFFEEQGYGAPAQDFTASLPRPQAMPTPEQAALLLGRNSMPMRAPAAEQEGAPRQEADNYDDLEDDELLELTEDRGLASTPANPARAPGFDLDSRGVDAVNEAMQMIGASQTGTNNDPELKAKLQKQMDAQEGSIDESQDIYEQLKAMPKRADLSPLLNLTDTWTGSKLAQGYKAPASPEERLADLLKFSDVVTKQRDQFTDSLVKQAGAGSNSTMWRSLANLKARRTRNAEDDLHKIAKDLAPAATAVAAMADLNKEIGGLDNPNAVKELEGMGSWMDEANQPQWMTERGSRIRMLADTALTEYVQLKSGLTSTPEERARLQANLGRSLFPTKQSAVQGLKNLQKLLEANIEAKQAGFSPDTVQAYENQNGPTLGRFRKLMGAKPSMTPAERKARIEKLKAIKAQEGQKVPQ